MSRVGIVFIKNCVNIIVWTFSKFQKNINSYIEHKVWNIHINNVSKIIYINTCKHICSCACRHICSCAYIMQGSWQAHPNASSVQTLRRDKGFIEFSLINTSETIPKKYKETIP